MPTIKWFIRKPRHAGGDRIIAIIGFKSGLEEVGFVRPKRQVGFTIQLGAMMPLKGEIMVY